MKKMIIFVVFVFMCAGCHKSLINPGINENGGNSNHLLDEVGDKPTPTLTPSPSPSLSPSPSPSPSPSSAPSSSGFWSRIFGNN